MVEYATTERLRRSAGQILNEERTRIVKAAESLSISGSTFLSHSSRDKEVLPYVIRILQNEGTRVYVDKKDDELPPYTSRVTAQMLRGRIVECSKFILLASTNSKNSRWVPWELGLSDGYKNPANIAVFPHVDSITETRWTEQEYLGIYDRIVWGRMQGQTNERWLVLNQETNTAKTLSEWLS